MISIINTFKEILQDKIGSPIFRTWIFIWLVVNWRIPFVWFFISENKLPNNTFKLDYIENTLLSPWYNLFLPALLTLASLGISPLMNWAYIKWTYFINVKIANTKKTLEKKEIIDTDMYFNLKSEKDELTTKYSGLIKDFEIINKQTLEEYELLKNENLKLKQDIEKLQNEKNHDNIRNKKLLMINKKE